MGFTRLFLSVDEEQYLDAAAAIKELTGYVVISDMQYGCALESRRYAAEIVQQESDLIENAIAELLKV